MFILFSLAVMRMSGAVLLNPIFGRRNFPSRAKAGLVFVLSLMLYAVTGGVLEREPRSLLEYGVMLIAELLFGYVMGFAMELSVLVVRFASSVMDHIMGLSMAQVYDPQYNAQMSVTSQLYYIFFMLLFFAVDGHLRLLDIVFGTIRLVPLGTVSVGPGLAQAVLELFEKSILMGLQYAMPLIALELLVEIIVGVIMRMIPGINVFTINFQVKISAGLLMLWFLFSPMTDKLKVMVDDMLKNVLDLVLMMR